MSVSTNGVLSRALLLGIAFVFCGAPAFAQSADPQPQISGSPAVMADEQQPYVFNATALVPGGGGTQFAIENLPHWAVFDPSSGRLEGVPQPGDAGVYENIVISMTNGVASASLPPFSIEVYPLPEPSLEPSPGDVSPATGAVPLSWEPPVANEDGSTLIDLAGYRIYAGPSPEELTLLVGVDSPGLTDFVVESLEAGAHSFAISAVNASGTEGQLSETVSTLIR